MHVYVYIYTNIYVCVCIYCVFVVMDSPITLAKLWTNVNPNTEAPGL